jgi:ABC-type microcin C transport system duplicated ATPase subunit YejF
VSGTKGAPVIEVKDLNISFKTAAGSIKVVENVSFAISKDPMFLFLAKNMIILSVDTCALMFAVTEF